MISVLYQAPRLKLERRSLRQLKKTGLANQVVVDQETFDKKLEELDGKRLHTVYHGSPHSLKGGGTVSGFVVDGVVYLNPSVLNTNTPIHEFAHLRVTSTRGSMSLNVRVPRSG